MEYERIHPKPSSSSLGGGISPSKLRFMLLGVEKKRKQEEDHDEELRSKASDDDARGGVREACCKDVDIVMTLLPEACSPSNAQTEPEGGRGGLGLKDNDSFDPAVSGAFEFQRAERATAAHRSSGAVPLFSKPAPSKWDDAQKWIASPTSSWSAKGGGQTKKTGHASRQPPSKVVFEVSEEPDTKRVDRSQVLNKDGGGHKGVTWASDPGPVLDSYSKPASFVESSATDSAVNRSQHGSSTAQSDTAFISPPSTVRSVSMRDTGTEMTPIVSQEPSRTGTPIRATTPILSPSSSRPSSPGKATPSLTPLESADGQGEDNKSELTEKELKLKTRREIMALGTKLGKTNIAAWASKEEDKDDSSAPKIVSMDPPDREVIESRAASWEEAEKAKYLARFKREEIKIQAWENHQKAKAEAAMRKIEVKMERARADAQGRLMSKLAAARQKAEEKLAAAEGEKSRQSTKAAQQADFIRRTGQFPSSFSCWGCCS